MAGGYTKQVEIFTIIGQALAIANADRDGVRRAVEALTAKRHRKKTLQQAAWDAYLNYRGELQTPRA